MVNKQILPTQSRSADPIFPILKKKLFSPVPGIFSNSIAFVIFTMYS